MVACKVYIGGVQDRQLVMIIRKTKCTVGSVQCAVAVKNTSFIKINIAKILTKQFLLMLRNTSQSMRV